MVFKRLVQRASSRIPELDCTVVQHKGEKATGKIQL
jgi:hypothetical protein